MTGDTGCSQNHGQKTARFQKRPRSSKGAFPRSRMSKTFWNACAPEKSRTLRSKSDTTRSAGRTWPTSRSCKSKGRCSIPKPQRYELEGAQGVGELKMED